MRRLRTAMASQRLPYPLPTESRPHEIMTQRAHRPQPALARLPVLKPQLPPAASILPYLEAIDACRRYSNAGPLITQLEEELSRRLGFRDQEIGRAACRERV